MAVCVCGEGDMVAPIYYNSSDKIAIDPVGPGMMTGVYRAVNNIKKSVAIFHGPQGCHENMYAQACFVHDRPGYGNEDCFEPVLPSTIIADNDLVLGPEGRLETAAHGVGKVMHPQLIVGMSSDAAEIIGEDAANLLESADLPSDVRTMWVQCSGFKGSWVDGYSLSLSSLTGLMTPARSEDVSVNLLGFSGQSITDVADVRELKRLLKRIGVEVNSVLLCETTVEEIERSPQASLNLVIYEEFGLSAAKAMQDKFGLEYLVLPPPIGFSATSAWLEAVNQALDQHIPDIDRVIEDEMRRWAEPIRAFTSAATVPLRCAVCADPSLAVGLTTALVELGSDISLVAVRTRPGELALARFERMDQAQEIMVMVEPEDACIADVLVDRGCDVVFGSTMERFTARACGARLVECVFPSVRTIGWDEPIVGYRGQATLARHLARLFLDQVI